MIFQGVRIPATLSLPDSLYSDDQGDVYADLIYTGCGEPLGSGCKLTGGEAVAEGWGGKDSGSNSCNSCQCSGGALMCTLMPCPPPLVGGCAGTQHGCCDDGKTSARGPNKAGCPMGTGVKDRDGVRCCTKDTPALEQCRECGAGRTLAANDVCHQFCEDSSKPPVERKADCPAGTQTWRT